MIFIYLDMNLNSLTPTSKILKKLANYSSGQPVTSGDVPNIAIINTCDVIESKRLVENVIFGVKSQGAGIFVHNVPDFGFHNTISPMTAKYAESFRRVAVSNAEAIIRTNMVDGVVIIADCEVTAAGLLEGCLKTNCPALVLPCALLIIDNREILRTAGRVTSGEITSVQCEDIARNSAEARCDGTFFDLLGHVGLSVDTADACNPVSGARFIAAKNTGEKIVSYAKDLNSPKKLLNKNTYQSLIEYCLQSGGNISALALINKLYAANDVKTAHEFLGERASKISPTTSRVVLAKGTACSGGGYIQYGESTIPMFSGKAWVYATPEDADTALLLGNIPKGSVVVLHNCVDVNVSAFAYAIEGMGREKDIALVTDGICEKTNVLVVQMCTPNSLANEEFANIQNGDALEIDIARGRLNTSIMAKDQKVRAKKNTNRKQTVYF